MAIAQFPAARGCGSAVFTSQSRKWLTERFAHLPQVRLVFGEQLPHLAESPGNFEDL
jgi:hypothetical protein